MGIYKITPFTFTDFPSKIACIAWFSGCNMRCVYCYNKEIVNAGTCIKNSDFLKFLQNRVNKLNGVVFSGGECTKDPDFTELIKSVKKLGFAIKVDTNGTNLKALKESIDFIDYIALDFKATKDKFYSITNSNLYNEFIKTLKFLIEKNFPFEVRTTVHSDFLDENDISQMAEILSSFGYKNSYFLQNFLYTNDDFGNLSEQNRKIEISKIKTNLKIIFRND